MIRQVAYLVEEKRSALSDLELSDPVGMSVRKSALAMSEQLAFEQRLGQRSHIDGHHQLVPAQRATVYFPGHHFFSGPVLAGNQHIGIGLRYFLDQSENTAHCFRLAPKHRLGRRKPLTDFRQILDFPFRPAQIVDRQQSGNQLVVVPRLDDKIGGPVLDGIDGQIDVGIGGKQHDRKRRIGLFDPGQPEQTFVSVVDSCREIHVEQHQIDPLFAQNRRNPVRRGNHDRSGEIFFQQ